MGKINFKKNYLPFLLFLVISISICIPYIFSLHGLIPVDGWDLRIHLASVHESYINLISGNIGNVFTGINTVSFGGIGVPFSSFYPIFTFIPEIFFHAIFNNAWYGFLAFESMVLFLIFSSMYLVSLKLNLSKIGATISAIIYGFSPFVTTWMFFVYDIHSEIAMIFFPIIFYGVWSTVKGENDKYQYIIMGMTLTILTHVLSAIIASFMVLFICFYLIFVKDSYINKLNRFYLILKSAVLTFLLTSFWTIPLLQNLIITGKLNISRYINLKESAISPKGIIFGGNAFLSNSYASLFGIGIIGLISLILILINFKRFKFEYKYLFLGFILFFFISSKLFPWQLINDYVTLLQFPFRFTSIGFMFLAFVFGHCIDSMNVNLLTKLIILISFISIGMINSYKMIVTNRTSSAVISKTTENIGENNHGFMYVDNNQFEKINWLTDAQDYLPKKSEPIISKLYSKNIGEMNSNIKVKQISRESGFNFISYKIKVDQNVDKLDLPNVYYPGIHIYVDGEEVPIEQGSHGQIQIKVKKGYSNIELIYKRTLIKMLFEIVSLLTFIVSIYLFFKKLYNHN